MPVCAVVLSYLVLPNLPSLLSIQWLEALPHGYVNLEFLLIGALGVFLPRPAVFLLLLADSLADFAYTICYTYQFSLENLLASLRYLSVLPKGRVLAGGGVLLLAILACAVLALVRPRPRNRAWTAGSLLLLALALLPVDVLSGQNSIWHKDVSFISYRLTRSPVLALGVREASAHTTNSLSLQAGNAPMPSASSQAISFLNGRQGSEEPPNVVLIVVESWGLPLDAHLAQELTGSYGDPGIARSYRVTYGTVPFTGLTVPGEARELCHSALGFGVLRASAEQAKQCLPALFHARGYQNTAIHGYVGQMFYRSAWYPQLGFDQALFGPDLEKIGLPRCRGAFPGICDASIAGWIGDSLRMSGKSRPRFIYWVTLNSHIPVPATPDLRADGVCATEPALRDSPALCSWFRLVRAVHQSVSQAALQVARRPTVFVLVGDHAPPFGDPQLRRGFSSTQVPYVMLTPKSAAPR
jgi:phosphoglycerol transferase MdoB-like AlkP superfamily enzyme